MDSKERIVSGRRGAAHEGLQHLGAKKFPRIESGMIGPKHDDAGLLGPFLELSVG